MGMLNHSAMRTFLEAAGILHVTAVRSLRAEEVDQLLHLGAVRCVVTHGVDGKPEWLEPAERKRRWEQEIKPHLANPTSCRSRR